VESLRDSVGTPPVVREIAGKSEIFRRLGGSQGKFLVNFQIQLEKTPKQARFTLIVSLWCHI